MKRCLIFFFFLLTLAFSSHAYAQEVDFELSPPRILITGKTAGIVQTPLTIKNNSQDTLRLTREFFPFTASRLEDGTVFYPQRPSKQTLVFLEKYVKVKENDTAITEVTLAPYQEKHLKLVVTIPKQQNDNDYYFSIVFVSEGINANSYPRPAIGVTAVTTIRTGIATNVLVSLHKDTTSENLTIEQFTTNKFFPKGPVPFSLKVHNNGDTLVAVKGHIIVYNMFGQPIGNIAVAPAYVLANTGRYLNNSQNSKNDRERATNEVLSTSRPIMLWGETFLLGPYSAELTLSYGQKETTFVRTIHFFALPLEAAITIVLLLFLFLFMKERIKRYL